MGRAKEGGGQNIAAWGGAGGLRLPAPAREEGSPVLSTLRPFGQRSRSQRLEDIGEILPRQSRPIGLALLAVDALLASEP